MVRDIVPKKPKQITVPFKVVNSYKGFTLIELLVVISTISLLATSVIASIMRARIKGNNIRRTAEIRNVVNALALAYEDYQKFPCSGPVSSQGITQNQYNQIMQ